MTEQVHSASILIDYFLPSSHTFTLVSAMKLKVHRRWQPLVLEAVLDRLKMHYIDRRNITDAEDQVQTFFFFLVRKEEVKAKSQSKHTGLVPCCLFVSASTTTGCPTAHLVERAPQVHKDPVLGSSRGFDSVQCLPPITNLSFVGK